MLTDGHTDDFTKLMLAGRVVEDEEERRVFLNALKGLPDTEQTTCKLTGDYDSLLGFTKHLNLVVPLTIWPVPSFKYTLWRSLHIPAISISTGEVSLRVNEDK